MWGSKGSFPKRRSFCSGCYITGICFVLQYYFAGSTHIGGLLLQIFPGHDGRFTVGRPKTYKRHGRPFFVDTEDLPHRIFVAGMGSSHAKWLLIYIGVCLWLLRVTSKKNKSQRQTPWPPHHIIQQEPKEESYDNKILLCHNCHHLYHNNKGPSLQDLLDIKKRLLCKILTQQGVNAIKESYRKGLFVGSPYLLNHVVELQLLKPTETMSTIELSADKYVVIDAVYQLTPKGRQFAEKWNLT